MNSIVSSFITLTSKANLDLYPKNNIYNFTNQFCTTLNFNSKSKVALCEIHLPLNFRFVSEQEYLKEIFILSDLVNESFVGSSRFNILKVITIDKDKFPANCQVLFFDIFCFYSISQSSVTSVTFKITDTRGNILKTDKETDFDETFIVLKIK